jgi:hypothetical protein
MVIHCQRRILLKNDDKAKSPKGGRRKTEMKLRFKVVEVNDLKLMGSK